MINTRKRLNPEDDLLAIPAFLDRRLWTEKQWKKSRDAMARVEREERERQNEQYQTNSQIFRGIRRLKHHKVMKDHRRRQRQAEKDDKRAARFKRQRIQGRHDEMILYALKRGEDTVGKISKRTDLPTKEVRRSLKRLVKVSLVNKVSSRRYEVIVRKRRRLSDVR